MVQKLIWMSLFLLYSCSPTSIEDLRLEGAKEMKLLTQELKKIENKEDIQKATPVLEKRFVKIAKLLIATKNFTADFEEVQNGAGDELFREFARLYEIPGLKEALEKTQLEAVRILDRNINNL